MDERDGYVSNTESAGGALITGNSGVGKSVFLTYLMKELRSLPRPPSIVYHKIAAQACWVIPPPGRPALVYHDVTRDMVSDTSVVYFASFELVNIQFASSHILHEVYNRTIQRNLDKVLRFVDATSLNTVWSSARGNIFELCLSHDFLQAGGTFPVQQFVDSCKAVRGRRANGIR